MHASPLAAQVSAFDPSLPIADNKTPPASWYIDPAFHQLERDGVFAGSWLCAGRLDQVAEPGDFFTVSYLDKPVVVTRDAERRLHALLNVCAHHGTRVADAAGHCDALVCPYHGWRYDLDGRLLEAPRAGNIAAHRDDLRLSPIAVDVWDPFVWISFAAEPQPLEAFLSGLETEREALDLDALRFVHQRRYTLDCNWKVFADNYLDGGYHVPQLHGQLAGGLDLSGYRTHLGEHYSVQTCPGSGTSDRVGGTAVYIWCYPNFAINRYGDWLDTNLVLPLGPDRCEVVFDYYHRGEIDPETLARALAESDRVQQEDIAICDRVQAGLASTVYDRGVYAPRFESPMYHFHRALARDHRAALGL